MTETADAPALEQLLQFLKENRGFDFTGYKRPSLERRIGKRMQEVRVSGYPEYLEYLRRNPPEFAALFDTILINVTAFFRDPEHWRYLADRVLPQLIESKTIGEPIRVWSTGCATGEEAYTVGILLAEALGEERFTAEVKIYATDVDEDALTTGRHGDYDAKAVQAVPEELLERYFEPLNGRFAFRKDLRRTVIFGRHDLIQDPPISRVDLLIARNTLMYLDGDTQRQILGNFHFALRDTGVLFLGKSEVLLTRSKLFTPISLKHRVFSKIVTAPANERMPVQVERENPDSSNRLRDIEFESASIAQIVVDSAGIMAMANAQARTLFGLGRTDVGKPLKDHEISYRPVELRAPIDEALSKHRPVHLREIEWPPGAADPRYLDVQVTPLYARDGNAVGTTVSFSDVTRYRKLQEGLETSKRELENAYEELQSTAEELETTNEELQSTNEELETMNEELQSTNEELETMNDELAQRTDELNDANTFLGSVLDGLRSGVVVLDREGQVLAWSPQATELWGLRADEALNHYFLNLDIGLPVGALRDPIRSAFKGESNEVVVDATNRLGRSISCKVTCRPLSTPAGEITGAILLMEVPE